jgi:hypothetical protein
VRTGLDRVDDPVVDARGDQQPHHDDQENKSNAVPCLRMLGNPREFFLEDTAQLKAKQHLAPSISIRVSSSATLTFCPASMLQRISLSGPCSSELAILHLRTELKPRTVVHGISNGSAP